jgi:uncharacterized protein
MNDPTSSWPCLHAARDGVVLAVTVVPGASRTEVAGLHGDALRVRLAAPPVDGKANDALVAWLAHELHCPRRDVVLLRGHAARRKQIALALPLDAVAQWLAQRVSRG